MTEPKHIPLTARMQSWAEHWAEEFRHLLQVPDDARDVEFEEESDANPDRP
jgi:hypothetical protein